MTSRELLAAYDPPAKWESIRLRWLSKRYAGGTPDTKNAEYWEGGTIPWLNSGAVNQGTITEPSDYITELALKESSAKWIPRGALVMALAGQGKTKATVGYLDIQTTGNQSLAAVVPEKIDGKYLYWWLSSQYLTIRNLSSQDGRDGLNLGMIGSIVCPVPPLDTQQRIARFLDEKTARIDGMIEKKRELLNRLAEKRQALIKRAVTKGLNAQTPMKPSGIDWLGDIPAHWEIRGLTKCTNRVDYRGATPEKSNSGVFLVTAKNIKNGQIDYEASREYIPEEAYEHVMRRGKPQLGEVLFTTEAPLGEIARVDHTDIALAQRIIKFSTALEDLTNDYLAYWMYSSAFRADVVSRATGSTALGIKASKIVELRCLLPPKHEQAEISTFLDHDAAARNDAVTGIQISVEGLTEYRAALITAAVTGQIAELR